MIVEKFNYQALCRHSENGRRFYQTPDGKKLPSVTTILDATKPEHQRKVLAEWRNRVGQEKAQQITTEAASRGTRMHTYLENYVKTGILKEKGSNPFTWASYEMAKVMIDQGLCNVSEFWGVEIPLYFPQIYAGTSDGVGIHCDQEAILDYKQSNKPKKAEWIDDYKLQLAAYAEAHNELHGTRISRGVILMCVKPQVDDQGHLISQPQYQEFVIEGAEFEEWRRKWWQRVEEYYTKNH